MQIGYRVNTPVTPQEFTRLLNDSFLGERRPVDDPECMAGMIENANLVVSARDKGRLLQRWQDPHAVVPLPLW